MSVKIKAKDQTRFINNVNFVLVHFFVLLGPPLVVGLSTEKRRKGTASS